MPPLSYLPQPPGLRGLALVVGGEVEGGGGVLSGGGELTYKELKAALDLQERIDRLAEQMEKNEAVGGLKAARGSAPVQGGNSVSSTQTAAEIPEEIRELEGRLRIEQAIIHRCLEKMPFTELERKLMILRYVECKPWKDVADRIGYGPSRTYDYHKSALKKFGVHRSSSDL